MFVGNVNATLIAASGMTQVATTVDSTFTASDLTLVHSANTASAFSNHFYMSRWDIPINQNKYYKTTILFSKKIFLKI